MPAVLLNPDFLQLLHEPLSSEGFDVIAIPRCTDLHQDLRGHVDLSFSLVGATLVVRPDVPDSFLSRLYDSVSIRKGLTMLSPAYPGDIAYNVSPLNDYYFHKLSHTDPSLREVLEEERRVPIDIKQGYSRCSILPLGRSIVTADTGAIIKAENAGISVCDITPGHIELPGFNYGFIGGCGGTYENVLYLTGTLRKHPDEKKIRGFIANSGYIVRELTENKLIDVGSLFFI